MSDCKDCFLVKALLEAQQKLQEQQAQSIAMMASRAIEDARRKGPEKAPQAHTEICEVGAGGGPGGFVVYFTLPGIDHVRLSISDTEEFIDLLQKHLRAVTELEARERAQEGARAK